MEASQSYFELARPAWLAVLVVLLPLVVYSTRRSLTGFSRGRRALSLVCRVLLLFALVAALAGPRAVRTTSEQFLVLAVDRSESIAETSREAEEAFSGEVIGAAGEERVAVLPFAAEPAPSGRLADAELDIRGTNLAAAIEMASTMIPSNRVPHVVLLTDGLETEGDALKAARGADLPVSTVPLAARAEPEVYVEAVRTPGSVREGETFDVVVIVHSSHADEGDVKLFQEDRLVATERVAVAEGETRVRFRRTMDGEASAEFTARIEGFDDMILENNWGVAVVFGLPRPRVLVIENEVRSARRLAAALEGEKIEVDVRRPEAMPEPPAELEGYEVVLLSNVPARSFSAQQMEALAAYVGDLGGGLIVVGGDQALTPGGYRGTTLEEILPVLCEFTETDERPKLAMVLVLDRSGSMREGGAIELAREATRRAVRMLDAKDEVGVLAFQDFSEWVSPIRPCSDREEVLERIDTIAAEGGTNMYPAMERAYLALRETPTELKHVIVLTDGISHPGDFHGLAAAMGEAGITVSTVAVGQEAVRPLLEDIARLGKGHHYHCDTAEAVPEIFALETATAGKMGIIEKPFRPKLTARLPALAEIDLERAPSLLGYVETRPKPDSQTVLTSEGGDPVLIWWRYGRGVSVAFTSDAGSRWAAAWLRWPDFAGFWAQLARHALGKRGAEGFDVRVRQQHGRATVIVDAVDVKGRFVNDAEVTLTVVDPAGVSRRLGADQVAPGRYAAEVATPAQGVYSLVLSVDRGGGTVLEERRGVAVGFPDELRTRATDHDLLRAIAEATGGVYEPSPAMLAGPGDGSVYSTVLFWPYFLAAAVVVLVIDVAVRRVPTFGARRGKGE